MAPQPLPPYLVRGSRPERIYALTTDLVDDIDNVNQDQIDGEFFGASPPTATRTRNGASPCRWNRGAARRTRHMGRREPRLQKPPRTAGRRMQRK